MKVFIRGFMIIMLFGFGFCIHQDIYAADNVNKEAYVDVRKKELYLRFSGFSDVNSYEYSVKSQEGEVVEGSCGGSLTVPLADSYLNDQTYEMTLKSQGKKIFTVYYFTGHMIDNFVVNESNGSLICSWNPSSNAAYDGYYLYLYKEDDINPVLKAAIADNKSSSFKTSLPSSLKTGKYRAEIVGYKTIGQTIYLGDGENSGLIYVRSPSSVTGLKVTPDTRSALLSWNSSAYASYYRVYRRLSTASVYTLVKKKLNADSVLITGLKPGKKYYFKVEPVAALGSVTRYGKQSSAVSATIPVVAGKVTQLKTNIDSKYRIYLTWKKVRAATSYTIYYKKHNTKKYKKLASTKKTSYYPKKLKGNKNYDVIVYAVTKKESKSYQSDKPSVTIHLNPEKEVNRLLAAKVRSIGYVGHREVYTSKKYPTKVKLAFVNYRGYKSSSKYLIWISHYTQQVTIFKGSKGKWRIHRTFTVATGTAKNHSPRGVFKVGKKEYEWKYINTHIIYVTHYYKGNAFHSRPLYYGGGVATSTIGRPVSHGCIRCYTEDARYIYKNIPRGTTVVSY